MKDKNLSPLIYLLSIYDFQLLIMTINEYNRESDFPKNLPPHIGTTGEVIKSESGELLFRIIALRDSYHASKNQLGGFISSSSKIIGDNAWINGNAIVERNSTIQDNVLVQDNAIVADNSILKGNAKVKDEAIINNSTICDEAIISYHAAVNNSLVYDYSRITGNARLEHCITIGNTYIDELHKYERQFLINENEERNPNAVTSVIDENNIRIPFTLDEGEEIVEIYNGIPIIVAKLPGETSNISFAPNPEKGNHRFYVDNDDSKRTGRRTSLGLSFDEQYKAAKIHIDFTNRKKALCQVFKNGKLPNDDVVIKSITPEKIETLKNNFSHLPIIQRYFNHHKLYFEHEQWEQNPPIAIGNPKLEQLLKEQIDSVPDKIEDWEFTDEQKMMLLLNNAFHVHKYPSLLISSIQITADNKIERYSYYEDRSDGSEPETKIMCRKDVEFYMHKEPTDNLNMSVNLSKEEDIQIKQSIRR